jgi:hypothetical protein
LAAREQPSAPRQEGVGRSSHRDLGVDPEPPVVPEFAGPWPSAELGLMFPGLAPAFCQLWGLAESSEVIKAAGAPDLEKPFLKAHLDLPGVASLS